MNKKLADWLSELIGVLGVVGLAIGAMALIGYFLSLRGLYDWLPGTTPMAISTAAAIVALGLSSMLTGFVLLALSRRIEGLGKCK